MEKIINGGEARLATRMNQSVERGPIKTAARIHQRPAHAFSHGIDFIFHEACIVFIEKTIMLRKRNTVEPVTVLVMTDATLETTQEKTLEHDRLRGIRLLLVLRPLQWESAVWRYRHCCDKEPSNRGLRPVRLPDPCCSTCTSRAVRRNER